MSDPSIVTWFPRVNQIRSGFSGIIHISFNYLLLDDYSSNKSISEYLMENLNKSSLLC